MQERTSDILATLVVSPTVLMLNRFTHAHWKAKHN